MHKYEKVKTCRCTIPLELYSAFRKKISIEGWTIQQALALLIKDYVEEDSNIEDEE